MFMIFYNTSHQDSISISFLAREDACTYLIDLGVPVGVFDDTGNSAISLMIEKIPSVAVTALNQFVIVQQAFRRKFIYLNYLEEDPIKWKHQNSVTNEYGVHLEIDEETKKKWKKENKMACPATALKVLFANPL